MAEQSGDTAGSKDSAYVIVQETPEADSGTMAETAWVVAELATPGPSRDRIMSLETASVVPVSDYCQRWELWNSKQLLGTYSSVQHATQAGSMYSGTFTGFNQKLSRFWQSYTTTGLTANYEYMRWVQQNTDGSLLITEFVIIPVKVTCGS